jgi:regulation of enolase protein 1 (concanavalin A-like superfamily)
MSCCFELLALSESQKRCSANRTGGVSTVSRVVVRCSAAQIRYRMSRVESAARVRKTRVGSPHVGQRNAAFLTFGIGGSLDLLDDPEQLRLALVV